MDRLPALPLDGRDLPKGWLSLFEAQVLYALALAARGPVIEVGSWIGRSTAALAAGVRDNPIGRPIFDVFDFGIAGAAEWRRRFGHDPFDFPDREHFLEVILHPGGIPALLKANLARLDLDQYLNMMAFGDFRTSGIKRTYDVGFCDAAHGVEEIRANTPALLELLNREDFALAFDDVITDEQVEVVRELVKPDRLIQMREQDPYSKITIALRGSYATDLPWVENI